MKATEWIMAKRAIRATLVGGYTEGDLDEVRDGLKGIIAGRDKGIDRLLSQYYKNLV